MTTEEYIEFCKANDIPSLALREMPSQNPSSPQETSEPHILHHKTLAEAPRIQPPPGKDYSHLCNVKYHAARDWWAKLTPEQRKMESAKRRGNRRAGKI